MLISRNTISNRLQPFFRNISLGFFTRLKRRNRCSSATRGAVITRLNDG
jgi:hypothetical protein